MAQSDEEYAGMWPEGMLRCRAYSPTRRLVLPSDALGQQYHADEQPPDIHAMAHVDPDRFNGGRQDLMLEVERRLIDELVDHAIKERAWPVAPVITWQIWRAQWHTWQEIHWPPLARHLKVTDDPNAYD